MKILVIGLIKFYQNYISQLSKLIWPGGVCRFSPTCSQYTVEAIRKKGLIAGIRLGFSRTARCNPFSEGGFDPIL